jgi:hypothetical protein
MPMRPRLWSISALAVETRKNPRTIARALRATPAEGTVSGGHDGWFLSTALAALASYERSSDQLAVRPLSSGNGGGASAALPAQLEQLAGDIDAGMRRFRAAGPDERLKVLEGFGTKVGTFDRLLEQSIVVQGPDAAVILSAFRDRHVGRLVREIAGLLGRA